MARKKRFDEKEIIQDATNLFWEKGFCQTSIQDLVDYLGVNRASLYDTYHDKEGLFKACFLAYRQNIFTTATDIINNEKSAKKGLKNLLNTLIHQLSSDTDKKGCLISNTCAELIPSKHKKTHHLLDETKDLWLKIIYDLLKKGSKNNELKNNTDIQKTSHAIYTSMVGASILAKINTNTKDLQNSLNVHFNVFK